MSRRRPTDPAASIRQRLFNLARERGEDYQRTAFHYARERFLYRLSRSEHSGSFVLKGAMLFAVWADAAYRPTRDVDMLGYGDSSPDRLTEVVRDICAVPVDPPDGLIFDGDTIRVDEIREGQQYQGQRVRLQARLGEMLLPVQIDVGYGDVVIPGPQAIEYPVLLSDQPRPRLRAYPRETVVAEKLQAMVALGMANSRMKDFYDLWIISRTSTIEGATLAQAIAATFARRNTPIPDGAPVALSDEFAQDSGKALQWRAFMTRDRVPAETISLDEVVQALRGFILEPMEAARSGDKLDRRWVTGGPWA